MESLYRERILDHYKHPRNNGVLDDPDREVDVDNPQCGDTLHLTMRVADDTIEDIRFEGDGCALSIAAASRLTEELMGEPLEAVKNISEEAMFGLLGLDRDEVSPMRYRCVLLARDALQGMEDTA